MGKHFWHGITLFDLGRYRDAIEAFSNALKDEPNSGAALAMRAAAWLNLGRTRNAKRDVEDALREEPNLGYAHYILSYVRANQGRAAAAEAAIREAIRLDPCATHFCRLAEIQFERHRYDESRKVIQQALAIDATHIESLLLMAKVLASQGKHESAKECVRQVLALNPEESQAHHAFGSLTLNSGSTSEALASLREARRLNPIAHNDRDTLAAAYGRLMWPFRVLDPCLIRIHTWPVVRRWCFLSAVTAVLLAMSFFLSSYPYFTLPVFLITLNWLAAPYAVDSWATALGKFLFRRDLDIPWYRLIPEPLRIVHPLIVHAIVSVVAAASAVIPLFSLLFLGFAPHFELILIFMRKLTIVESVVFAVIALFGVAYPIVMGFVFLEKPYNPIAALMCWASSLPVSYLLAVYRQ